MSIVYEQSDIVIAAVLRVITANDDKYVVRSQDSWFQLLTGDSDALNVVPGNSYDLTVESGAPTVSGVLSVPDISPAVIGCESSAFRSSNANSVAWGFVGYGEVGVPALFDSYLLQNNVEFLLCNTRLLAFVQEGGTSVTEIFDSNTSYSFTLSES